MEVVRPTVISDFAATAPEQVELDKELRAGESTSLVQVMKIRSAQRKSMNVRLIRV